MNASRGEAALVIAGTRYTLCLTLGALAEIETALGAEHLDALEARLARPAARDLLSILGALIRGGGHSLSDEELAALPVDLQSAARALGACFAAAGLSGR